LAFNTFSNRSLAFNTFSNRSFSFNRFSYCIASFFDIKIKHSKFSLFSEINNSITVYHSWFSLLICIICCKYCCVILCESFLISQHQYLFNNVPYLI
jgi:hypothetical protein